MIASAPSSLARACASPITSSNDAVDSTRMWPNSTAGRSGPPRDQKYTATGDSAGFVGNAGPVRVTCELSAGTHAAEPATRRHIDARASVLVTQQAVTTVLP